MGFYFFYFFIIFVFSLVPRTVVCRGLKVFFSDGIQFPSGVGYAHSLSLHVEVSRPVPK